MENNFEVRAFIKEDKDLIQSFYDDMGEESSSFFNVNHGNEKRTMGFFTGETKNTEFYAAVENGICIGLMFIWDLEKSVPWFGIAVRDNMQGKGVGTAMINYLKEMLKSRGCGGLLLRTAQSNIKAQKLYEKCGFERIGVHPSGEYLYILRLERDL